MSFISNIKMLFDDANALKNGDTTVQQLIDSGKGYSEYNPTPIEQVIEGVEEFGHEFSNAVENWVYKNTGQAHKTDEYIHEEELANSAYQRAAKDMQLAGLSKYGGLSGASSPSPSPGSGLLSTAIALQNLKSQKLAFDESRYNFNKAKEWGVPTNSVDQFAKYDALCKVLFGKPLTDYLDENEGGLIGMLQKLIGGQPDPLASAGEVDPSPVNEGAYVDQAQHAIDTVLRLDPTKAHTAPIYLKLSDFADRPISEGLGIPVSSSGAPDLTKEQFDIDSMSIKVLRDEFYDDIGLIARGQPEGLSMNKFCSKYVTLLKKEGIDQTHAIGMVRAWLLKDMDELGYSFDDHDKLWYYDH